MDTHPYPVHCLSARCEPPSYVRKSALLILVKAHHEKIIPEVNDDWNGGYMIQRTIKVRGEERGLKREREKDSALKQTHKNI